MVIFERWMLLRIFMALLVISASSQAGSVYKWIGVYGQSIGPEYGAFDCGIHPSGCQKQAEDWWKAAYPPQSFMFNVVWHFTVVNESGPPTMDGQYGGFTLGVSYDADYVGTCCGVEGQLLHYRYPDATNSQQAWFWTVSSLRLSYYVAASSIATLFAENGSCKVAQSPFSHCGDPINPANGNTYSTQQDVGSAGTSDVVFKRYYNSTDSSQSSIAAWRGSFGRSIRINSSIATYLPLSSAGSVTSSLYGDEASACLNGFAQIKAQVPKWSSATAIFSNGVCRLVQDGISIGGLAIYSADSEGLTAEASPPSFDYISDDGQTLRFYVINGVITAPPGTGLKLSRISNGYTLIDGHDNVEQYDINGKLLSVASRTGVVQTMAYDASGRLSGVSDNFGHQLVLGYDTQNRLISVSRH